ncbi:MAG: EF-hand domain-containing protein [Planctomycetota bacterium]
MKRNASICAVAALTILTANLDAAPPEGKRGEGRSAGQERGSRFGAQRGNRGGGDQTQLVARMLQEFDTDGDQKLDVNELTALMTSMRERRMGQGGSGGQRGPGGAMGQGQRRGPGEGGQRGQRGRQGRGAEGDQTAGGKKPRRPEAE